MDDEERSTREGTAMWDRANKDLHAIVCQIWGVVTTMITRRPKKRLWGARVGEIIRDLMDEMRGTSQDPDLYLVRAEQLGSDLSTHNKPTSVRQYKDITMIGISDEYPDALFITTLRDPKFTVGNIRRTMSAVYRENVSRNEKL